MARGTPHSDETRAAVLAALLEGQSVNKVAGAFKISRSTVIAWRDAAGIGSTPVQQEKRSELTDEIIDMIRENITTLKAQVRFLRDENWLRRQSASEIAVLHGVIADKTFRLLGAIATDDSEGGMPG